MFQFGTQFPIVNLRTDLRDDVMRTPIHFPPVTSHDSLPVKGPPGGWIKVQSRGSKNTQYRYFLCTALLKTQFVLAKLFYLNCCFVWILPKLAGLSRYLSPCVNRSHHRAGRLGNAFGESWCDAVSIERTQSPWAVFTCRVMNFHTAWRNISPLEFSFWPFTRRAALKSVPVVFHSLELMSLTK